MKSMDLLCSSAGSTAICPSMDEGSVVRRGMKHIDGLKTKTSVPCFSQHPFDPKKYYQKSSSSDQLRRKSSADITDLASSPPGSSRYLLSDIDHLSSSEDHPMVSSTNERRLYRSLESPVYKPSPTYLRDLYVHKSSSPRTSCSRAQVVELRVSIHCKGCEGKVRKHISKMEGVESYNIDLASKKVTVMGDVTPLGVLASISKVLWRLWTICSLLVNILEEYGVWIGISRQIAPWAYEVQWMNLQTRSSRPRGQILAFLFAAMVYHVWAGRNLRRFTTSRLNTSQRLWEIAVQLFVAGQKQAKWSRQLGLLGGWP